MIFGFDKTPMTRWGKEYSFVCFRVPESQRDSCHGGERATAGSPPPEDCLRGRGVSRVRFSLRSTARGTPRAVGANEMPRERHVTFEKGAATRFVSCYVPGPGLAGLACSIDCGPS